MYKTFTPRVKYKIATFSLVEVHVKIKHKNAYNQFYHQRGHSGERRKEHVQIHQNRVSHCVLYQTGQKPIKLHYKSHE